MKRYLTGFLSFSSDSSDSSTHAMSSSYFSHSHTDLYIARRPKTTQVGTPGVEGLETLQRNISLYCHETLQMPSRSFHPTKKAVVLLCTSQRWFKPPGIMGSPRDANEQPPLSQPLPRGNRSSNESIRRTESNQNGVNAWYGGSLSRILILQFPRRLLRNSAMLLAPVQPCLNGKPYLVDDGRFFEWKGQSRRCRLLSFNMIFL